LVASFIPPCNVIILSEYKVPLKRLSLKELPVTERPREKLIQQGEQTLSDAELLAILMGSGTQKESALQVAQRMLKEAGDLKALSGLTVTELRKRFHGIGPARAAQVKAALELSRRYSKQLKEERPRFSNSHAVFHHFHERFRGKRQEELWVAVVDMKNRLVHESEVTRGTLNGSLVHPREIYHRAISNAGAGVILVHNHPSGDPSPSPEDRRVTLQILEAGNLLGIPLLDHIIIGNESHYSFKDAGII
jgi:DNA repair protein RadC